MHSRLPCRLLFVSPSVLVPLRTVHFWNGQELQISFYKYIFNFCKITVSHLILRTENFKYWSSVVCTVAYNVHIDGEVSSTSSEVGKFEVVIIVSNITGPYVLWLFCGCVCVWSASYGLQPKSGSWGILNGVAGCLKIIYSFRSHLTERLS